MLKFSFMRKAIKEENGIVYVHCHAGVSRSSTLVLAYLMQEEDIPLQQALSLLRLKRPIVCPNPGFMRQLKEFEQVLSQVKSRLGPECSKKELQKEMEEKQQEKEDMIIKGSKAEAFEQIMMSYLVKKEAEILGVKDADEEEEKKE